MNTEIKEDLHIFFFPFMAEGHTIPLINIAKLFASKQGIKVSIITTPLNAPKLSSKILGHKIEILTIKFNCSEAGLPDGCEHLDLVPPEIGLNFFLATHVLAHPLEQILHQYRPNCLVSDTFFPWSTEVAAKYGVPRIVFSGTCFFSTCASLCMRLYQPYKNVKSDSDPFVIPDFPGEIELITRKLPEFVYKDTGFSEFYRKVKDVEMKSYGVLVNSFYELESEYVDHLRNVLGVKAWHIGPVSLWGGSSGRGESFVNDNEILEWLDSKKANSVVYICFGSMTSFTNEQLLEIAHGIEESGQIFIWVVKKSEKKDEEDDEEWLPRGFEERMEGKGLLIRGWAPQVSILEHEAVGGFVTHCRWNSTLEAISAGVKMVTWPVAAEQFYNEKLVTEVLRIGIPVGAKKWARKVGDSVKKEAITKAVRQLMVGDEAEEMKCRANKYADMARKAVENGGSSHSDFNSFIDEFKSKKIG
ncbi:probable UDP-glucosyl transferase 73B6 [Euphorbia lathyris]|uniref:probable UDP-glucosyl transferase 73B6 n=1 Tax=Euphorbia lathyris TaxID=212925 RepID=UPI003313F442